MNAATLACAPSGMAWDDINWVVVTQHVKRLQARIVKAIQVGRHNKAKALQWLLTHSFYGKALAVKRVTGNKGKNTAGVDKVTWKTSVAKTNAILSLKRRGYTPLPLRRVYIPKKNGKTRPLGIPAMKCRAMQALHLLALEPIAETTADLNSYGFRPERSTADAAAQCFIALAKKASAAWVLEADIQGCFDQISHDWMITNLPTDKVILQKWPILRGWANYHRHSVAKEAFGRVDHCVWSMLWQWATRRHPNRGARWVKEKYFKTRGTQNWVFTAAVEKEDGTIRELILFRESDMPIQRHIKIKSDANPHDPKWNWYFESLWGKKMQRSPKGRRKLYYVWLGQDGLCPDCQKPITKSTPWNTRYMVKKTTAGRTQ